MSRLLGINERPTLWLQRGLQWRIKEARYWHKTALRYAKLGYEVQARVQRRRRDMHLEAAHSYLDQLKTLR